MNMKEIVKAMLYAAVVMGTIIGIIILGLWIYTGSLIALTIALLFMWAAAAFLFYHIQRG